METQLSLTAKNVHPETMRYHPVEDGPTWQVDAWRELVGDFPVSKESVPTWHHSLAGSGRTWEILRRLYQIAPLYGEDDSSEYTRPWTLAELAAKWSVPVKDIESEHAAAVKFWKRHMEERQLGEKLANAGSVPEFQAGPDVEDEKIAPLLDKYGFGHEKIAANRKFIAKRIVELRPQFETAVYRETARQIVGMELNMRRYESLLGIKQLQLDKKLEDAAAGKNVDTSKLEPEFQKLEQALTSLSESHRTLMSEIGANEEEAEGQLRTAMDSWGYATDAMTAYYAKGERELLDGIFTAGDLRFLLTVTDVRDFHQYRPDVVVMIKEALLPENLWSGTFKPSPLQRELCRKLKKICDGLDEPVDASIAGIDDAKADEDEDSSTATPLDAPMSPAEIETGIPREKTPSSNDDDEGDFYANED